VQSGHFHVESYRIVGTSTTGGGVTSFIEGPPVDGIIAAKAIGKILLIIKLIEFDICYRRFTSHAAQRDY
jgi:hypothetical protein